MLQFIKKSIKERYQCLKSGKPGDRFIGYSRKFRPKKWIFLNIAFYAVSGLVCWAIAIPLLVLPGPAFIFILAGFGFMIAAIPQLARLMDVVEVGVRKIFRRSKK